MKNIFRFSMVAALLVAKAFLLVAMLGSVALSSALAGGKEVSAVATKTVADHAATADGNYYIAKGKQFKLCQRVLPLLNKHGYQAISADMNLFLEDKAFSLPKWEPMDKALMARASLESTKRWCDRLVKAAAGKYPAPASCPIQNEERYIAYYIANMEGFVAKFDLDFDGQADNILRDHNMLSTAGPPIMWRLFLLDTDTRPIPRGSDSISGDVLLHEGRAYIVTWGPLGESHFGIAETDRSMWDGGAGSAKSVCNFRKQGE